MGHRNNSNNSTSHHHHRHSSNNSTSQHHHHSNSSNSTSHHHNNSSSLINNHRHSNSSNSDKPHHSSSNLHKPHHLHSNSKPGVIRNKSEWLKVFHSNSSRCVWLQVYHLHSSSSKYEWRLEYSSKCNYPQEYPHSSTRQCFSNKQQLQHNSNALPLVLLRNSSSKSASLQGFLLSSTRRC